MPLIQKIQARPISFHSIKSLFKSTGSTASTELEKPLTSLPNATGIGAFAEPVTYQVLGSSSNLLNIKLPKSSILNLRYSSSNQKIIAMNGHINSLCLEISKTADSGLIFQRCFNEKEAMSFLIAPKAHNSCFAVAENGESNWILKKSSLLSWSGPGIRPVSPKNNYSYVQMIGSGSFAISCPGQLIQLDLKEGENIQVNTKSIVAYTHSRGDDGSFNELEGNVKSIVDFSVGRAPASLRFNWVLSYLKIPESVSTDPNFKMILHTLHSLTNYIKTAILKLKSLIPYHRSDVFVELKGPKTLFLTNSVHVNDRVLTKAEINRLTYT